MTVPDVGPAVPRPVALALLGLSEQATATDVVAAYRRLAKTTHPDVAGPRDPDAGRRFAALTDAYRALVPMPAAPSSTTPPATAPPPTAPPQGGPPGRGRIPVRVRVTRSPFIAGPVRDTRSPIIAGPVRISPLPPTPRSRDDH